MVAVDAALVLPAEEVGPAVAALVEDQWFDRKSVLVKPKDLAPHLVAFANADGGVILIGIQDKRVQGVDGYPHHVNGLRQAPFDCTQPPVRARFTEVLCVNDAGRPDHLLVVHVEPGERVHETTDGSCYLRVGDEYRRLTFDQRRELEYDRGQSQYDAQALSGIEISALDQSSILRYGEVIGVVGEAWRVLKARSLLTQSGGVTNAAYLLFDQRPQDHFPQAYVRVLRYLTPHRETGARQELAEGGDVRIEGPIPQVIEQARTLIEATIPRRRALGPDGVFEAVSIVPRDAWLEGLVNAVVHRSYSLAGDHVRVEIYPNRVEIESPGRFPGLADARNPLTIGRFARNPRIARVCAELRFGQELGEGIRRIFEEMRRTGLADPTYRQTSGSVRLVLAAVQRPDPRIAALLPAGSLEMLDQLRAVGGPMGTGDLAAALRVSRPVAIRRLRALEQAELVRWSGKSQTDPRAVWTVVDE
jgi:ATP-dependent DNA helicase RecG